MVVQHNISAMTANRYYGINNKGLAGSLEKLASGYAINRAGDNAAGLAVSEKMRAQIGGLTQASKNAEDGISLVQTFEGALQETDSILQRMRTLAVQSANGSYQDDVDRDAIQLEFDQLNDELNQIADTDFNGVVMLNGGEMADGLKAVDGKFDYTLKEGSVISKAQGLAQDAYNTAKTELDEAKKAFSETNYDLSENRTAPEWNTLDNEAYDKTAADEVWKTLGLTKTNSAGQEVADLDKATSVDITFQYDKDADTWTAVKGFDQSGNELDKDKVGALTATTVDANSTTITGNGGFKVSAGTATDIVNAVFDSTTAKTGDTVTITFTNAGADTFAPRNVGVNENSKEISTGATADVAKSDLGVSLASTKIQDSQMTESVDNAFKALEDAEISVTYTPKSDAEYASYSKTTTLTPAQYNALSDDEKAGYTANTEGTEYTKVETKTAAQYAEMSDAERTGYTGVGEPTKAGVSGDITFSIKGAGDETAQTVKISDAYDAANPPTITLTGADGTKSTYTVLREENAVSLQIKAPTVADPTTTEDTTVAKFTVNGMTAATAETTALDAIVKNGTVSAKVSVSESSYGGGASVTARPGDDKALDVSKVAKDALAKAQAKFDKAAADQAAITDLDSASAYLDTKGVSKSDAFDQSKAKMTYTDNMTLQVGARTKDAVNFTFNYNTDDLGGLEKNLDCSSRAGGLNTANLSLKTAKDANKAIDEIDKALNKVNMVRATFGAVQNRLEHKITNLDTNTENMTAAESRIRDTQMDKEMMKFTSAQILSQASQSMLAQANSLPQGVLQLLG